MNLAFLLVIIGLCFVAIGLAWAIAERHARKLYEAIQDLRVSVQPTPTVQPPAPSGGLPVSRVMYRNGDSWTEGQWVRVGSPAYRSALAVKHESGEIEVRRG